MQELFQIVGFFTCAAAIAFVLSYLLFRIPVRRLPYGLAQGALVRIKTSDGVHRTRFNRRRPNGLVFAAPLQRDHYVPIAVGEWVTVEAPMQDGVLLFRTTVAERDSHTHEIVLAIPEKIHREDRRLSSRVPVSGKEIQVEDRPAWLIDFSETGARFARNGPLPKGDRIRIDTEEGPLFGWVLDCSPNYVEGEGTHVVRARFEERADFSLS